MTHSCSLSPWAELAACPKCRQTLAISPPAPICRSCGRVFGYVGRSLNLLPADFPVPAPVQAAGYWKLPITGWIANLYVHHNQSRRVRTTLAEFLGQLREPCWGLTVGSGNAKLHPRMISLDVNAGPQVEVLGDAQCLPFADGVFSHLVSQEVFEHLPDPCRAMAEVSRVLRPGGMLYLQVPFVLGFHSGPHDYWRFTGPGLRRLVQSAGLEILSCVPAVGAGTSMYRIAVDFSAAVAAACWEKLYLPAKALAALACSPVLLANVLTTNDAPTNRIAGGFLCVARKN